MVNSLVVETPFQAGPVLVAGPATFLEDGVVNEEMEPMRFGSGKRRIGAWNEIR